jgi:hypothetical protein
MPLTAISMFGELGKKDPFYAGLYKIVLKNDFIWSLEAEKYLLANARPI